MAHLIESFRTLATQAVGPWLNGMLAALLLTGAVWLALRFARRLNAATRHVIWGVTLIAVVVLSFPRARSNDAAAAIRPTAIPDKAVRQRDTVAVAATPVLTGPIETTVESKPAINSASPMVNTASAAKLVTPAVVSPMKQPANPWQLKAGSWLMVLPCVWLTGTLLLLIRIVYALAHLRRLKRNTTPLPEELQAQLPSGAINLRCSMDINMPMAAGLTRPVVLIPTKLIGQLSGDELRQVVMHECAHLRRHDDWVNLAQQLLTALFWLQPAVWFINRQMIREREIACDDQVICQHGDAKPYALCLTRLAELTQLAPGPLLASGAIFSQGELARRVELLLDRQRNASTKLSWVAFIPGTALLGIAVAAVTHLTPIAVVAEPVQLAQAANPATVSTTPPAALPPTTAKAGDKERALIEEEIKLVEQQVANAEVAMKTGRGNQDDVLKYKRDLLELKRQLLAVEQRLRPFSLNPLESTNGLDANSLQAKLDQSTSDLKQKLEANQKAFTDKLATEQRYRSEKEKQKIAEEEKSRTEAQQEEMKRKTAMFESLLEIARKDKDASVRVTTVTSIGRLRLDASIDPLLQIASRDADEKVKIAAMEAVASLHSQHSVDALIERYESWKDQADAPALISLFYREEKQIVDANFGSYTFVPVIPQNAIDKCAEILVQSSDTDNGQSALFFLRSAKSEAGSRALIDVYDRCENDSIKLKIIILLGQRSDAFAEQKLMDIAKSDPNPKFREKALPMIVRPYSSNRNMTEDISWDNSVSKKPGKVNQPLPPIPQSR